MNHVLALSAGFRFEGNEITARFTEEVPEGTARLIDIVAKSDIDGQTEDGQMIYIAKTVGNLKRLNLLTRFVEEYACEKFLESVKNFYDQQEENLKRRNIQFNATDSLAELAGTCIYDSVVDGIKKLIDVERGRRALRDEEMRWYQTFVRETEENRKRD